MSEIKRPPKEVVEELRKICTGSFSDTLDDLGIKGYMSHQIRPIYPPERRVVGPAITVRWTPAREPMKCGLDSIKAGLIAIDKTKSGDVYVAAIEGQTIEDFRDIGLWGDLMALSASIRGMEGAVLDGATRDCDEIKRINFPTFARSISPTTTVRRVEAAGVNVPVICAGVLVNPGDIIVADTDGVVVIPQDIVREVLKKAKEFEEAEKKEREIIRSGKTWEELFKEGVRV